MKLTATIVVSLQCRTLAEAGALLDELVEPARVRGDVDVRSVDLHTPVTGPPVTLPHPHAPVPAPGIPHPLPGSG